MTSKEIAEIENKIKTLGFKLRKTDDIIPKRDRQALKRQEQSINTIVGAIEALKLTIEEKKFGKGESEEDITTWSQEIENELGKGDEVTKRLQQEIKILDSEDQEKEATELHKRNMEFERQLLEQKAEFESQHGNEKSSTQQLGKVSSAAKLPKLTITKFNGKIDEWLPFWGKFKAEIDSTDIPFLTKFGYLKELLEKQVRNDIDGLPFTEEGYLKAKEILENEYGQTSEIISSYVRNIAELPIITGTNPKKVKEFYKQLRFNVQSLETLKRVQDVRGNVRPTLEKLKGIKSDLARGTENWRDWDFNDLLKELKRWIEINPVEENASDKNQRRSSHLFNTQSKEMRGGNQCVYCGDMGHKSVCCTKVIRTAERRNVLAAKGLCFNCTGAKHRAGECRSKSRCQICERKHHTSICSKGEQHQSDQLLVAAGRSTTGVTYPVVLVQVEGIKCRALLDTGAGNSYASGALLDQVSKGKCKKQIRKIEMLFGASTREVELTTVEVADLSGNFSMPIELTKVDRGELLFLDNPNYGQIIAGNSHLAGVVMDDQDTKDRLPVHMILGAGDYAKLKTKSAPKIGQPGQPVAERTKFGWVIMSPGKEQFDVTNILLTQTSHLDYEELCRLDVLGLSDKPTNDQSDVYAEFKEQLVRDDEGWYETGLPWRGNHPTLPTNKDGSLRRLTTLQKKLKRQQLTSDYAEIIEDQKKSGVVESAEDPCTGSREFYIPHKPVLRANAESTKLRVVYDASAKAFDGAPSLNDCLHTGPPLQNKLWSVLVRGRFNPIALTGDLQKAFLQVRIRESDRDAMRFHWQQEEHLPLETLRFTRALFGLTSSPFLLGGVIDTHLQSWEKKEPQVVAKIRGELYVDDLISGSTTVKKVLEVKQKATVIFKDACFTLHKWHSNVLELEDKSTKCGSEEPTYAKQQLGTTLTSSSSILGLSWNKRQDLLSVTIPAEEAVLTKRGILTKLAKIYDPLGFISPVTLSGKIVYRAVCDTKTSWDAKLPQEQTKAWLKWESNLPQSFELPRSLPPYQEEIESVELHSFGDASAKGVAAVTYAVVRQPSGISQGLVTARSRLAKQGLTIPRLELIAGHMAVNLVSNVREALKDVSLTTTHCWLDSSVALFWIRGKGEYKQFVSNRVQKITSHAGIAWHYVPTSENPADVGSRGGRLENADLWWFGPKWLSAPENWPEDVSNEPSEKSQAEAKLVRKVLAVAVDQQIETEQVLHKFRLPKAARICAWMVRFANNAQRRRDQIGGPLTTDEVQRQMLAWEKQAQTNRNLEKDRLELNLQPNQDGLLECRGRVQGDYPIYLPDNCLFARRVVEQAHLQTLHGGVGLTMTKIRNRYWIPRLRQLVKKVRGTCHGCKRFQAIAYAAPPSANLPTSRTQGSSPFQVIGVDFAGPMRYRVSKQREGKAYILLYACSLTRGIYLDLLPSLETAECLMSLKKFIARRGRPERIYSDNGRTFIAAAKWMKTVMKDERLQRYLSTNEIRWQFNLSRAPWWGGQFERMIGLVKAAFNKAIGNALLSWKDIEEVLLDVEITLNNRPLNYVEDDIQLPVLTPNSMLFMRSNVLPELQPHRIETTDLRKRAKHLIKCKDAMWRRWSQEYLRSLRERHRIQKGSSQDVPAIGDVVIVKSEDKNRGKWPMGIVDSLIIGKDGVVRGARLRTGKSCMERALQQLYPLELSCDDQQPIPIQLHPTVKPFRPRRDAAVAARLRLQEIPGEAE